MLKEQTITPYIVPIAILSSAAIGFFAAWYNSLLNRQAGEIALRTDEICNALDLLKTESIKYWSRTDSKSDKYTEISITSNSHGISLQLNYLNKSLHAFNTPWWRFGDNQDNAHFLELETALRDLHKLITGGDFDVASTKESDLEKCRRISTKIERLKNNIRTFRKRY